MTSEPLVFVGRQDPRAVAWVAPGCDAITFGGLTERAEALRRRFLAAGLTKRTIIAAGSLAPLDLVTAFLAASSDWAFAAVNPHFSSAAREEYLRDLLPGALLDEALHLQPLAGGRILDASLCLLTSATTGRAKIVPRTKAQLEDAACTTRDALELSPSDRLLCLTPLHHLQALGSFFRSGPVEAALSMPDRLTPPGFPAGLMSFSPPGLPPVPRRWKPSSPFASRCLAAFASSGRSVRPCPRRRWPPWKTGSRFR
ncbi:MAG: hypothetical protein IPP47_18320 [Bryobacterales bacterium]|nr:hypothetical protein [Bryobacterales bacterium]